VLIATHAHIGHIRALSQFQEEFGVQVIAHELDADAIETGRGTFAELYDLSYKASPIDAGVVLTPRRFSPMDKFELKMPTKRPVKHHNPRRTPVNK